MAEPIDIGEAIAFPRAVEALRGAAASELRAWGVMAVGSLAIAGVFAFLLALSRTPGVEAFFPWPISFFQKGLVIHVVFSFVVWFLAVFGCLLSTATAALAGGEPRSDVLGRAALALTGVAMPLLFLPAFLDRGEPSLNNYVPAVIDPLYYGGLALLALGLVAAIARLFLALRGKARPLAADLLSILIGAAVFLAAVLCSLLALATLAGIAPSAAFNETLFWGSGHALQFLNTVLLLLAWHLLGRAGLGEPLLDGWALKAGVLWLGAFALAMPFLYVSPRGIEAAPARVLTDLQWAFAPAAGLAIAVMGVRLRGFLRRGGVLPWADPAFLCLVLSPLVFSVGGIFGVFVDGTDTRTPAHYHAVIAGITLAFMGLFYGLFLPLLRRPVRRGRLLYLQILLFAVGQTLAAGGMFLAGGHGAPRKTAGAEQGLKDVAEIVGMGLNGGGALLAIIGGLLFIWTVGGALLRKAGAAAEP